MILLDTSFLLTSLRQHRDLEEELGSLIAGRVRIVTLDPVLFELQRLARNRSSKTGGLARVALDVLEQRNVEILEMPFGLTDVDMAIVAFSLAERNPVAVATVDRGLRHTLSKNGIATVYPRGRRGLMISRAASLVRLK